MDITVEKQQEQQTAVPYTPPPPPDQSSQKKFRTPMVNGVLIALVILFGGVMAYNGIGHELTQLAGVSTEKIVTPTPSIMPTDTPVPSISPSIAPTQ